MKYDMKYEIYRMIYHIIFKGFTLKKCKYSHKFQVWGETLPAGHSSGDSLPTHRA